MEHDDAAAFIGVTVGELAGVVIAAGHVMHRANAACRAVGVDGPPPYLVAKRYHPARVRFHLHEVQRDILVEPVEEWDPFTDQDGHDRIANFVGQSEPKAFTRDGTPSGRTRLMP